PPSSRSRTGSPTRSSSRSSNEPPTSGTPARAVGRRCGCSSTCRASRPRPTTRPPSPPRADLRPLVLTPGDPLGVGPEVAAKALLRFRDRPVIVAGDAAAFGAEARRLGLRTARLGDAGPGEVPICEPEGDEPVEVRAIRWAVARCLDGTAGGLVT